MAGVEQHVRADRDRGAREVDLLDGLVAIAIDEVKKGQRYLTVVCDHFTGRVVWAANGRSKAVVGEFFDALGPDRSARLQFVSADDADWIRDTHDPEPADLSALVAMVREVGWNLGAVVKGLAARYTRLGPVGHDTGDDPVQTVGMIGLRLDDVTGHLADVDSALGHAHELAANLHRP